MARIGILALLIASLVGACSSPSTGAASPSAGVSASPSAIVSPLPSASGSAPHAGTTLTDQSRATLQVRVAGPQGGPDGSGVAPIHFHRAVRPAGTLPPGADGSKDSACPGTDPCGGP